MKKNLFLLFLLLFCVACADLATDESEKPLDAVVSNAFDTPSEAFPDAEKEIYTTRSGVVLEKLDTLYILQGDIILSSEQVALLDDSLTTRGAIHTGTTKYWPDCTVYYDFASDFTKRTDVLNAMAEISGQVYVKFSPKTKTSKNYIHFIHGMGNYSNYGKTGGAQNLSIEKVQGSVKGTVIHELCHALGLFHEMSRSDRDDYVEILWNNIESGKEHNFKTYSQMGNPGADVAAFNYMSIMMYSPHSFGKMVNGVEQQTIRRRDGQSYPSQSFYLADTDIATLRAIYGPPYGKIRNEYGYNNGWDEYGDYRYDVSFDTYMDFYEDEACTIPAVLPTPRYLNVKLHEEYGIRQGYTEKYSTVIVPAGVSSYCVGGGSAIRHEIQGSLADYEDVHVEVMNY